MAKKDYKIRVKFVFSGTAIVRAHNRKEAEVAAERYIATHLREVEPLDDCLSFQDWDISLKGETVINRRDEKGAER